MKKHAIIPVFISHRGCPNDCVFCNQKRITAREGDVTPEDAEKTINEWLTTLTPMREKGLQTIEVSFFGGSFTGIPMEEQTAFLKIAKNYKDSGLIDQIHLSTRPDYITREILDNLLKYSVDVIELGVQSFSDHVLEASGRGHNAAAVYSACRLIQEYDFTLGIQLMIGLPGDSLETCLFSAEETVKIGPQIARLYPTVTLHDTRLYEMYLKGEYIPLSLDEAVDRTRQMYEILTGAGINVIRVGLKSSEIMEDEIGFHPAFRQLVEGSLALHRIETQVLDLYPELEWFGSLDDEINALRPHMVIIANEHCYGNIFGHKGANRAYLSRRYPMITFRYAKDYEEQLELEDNEYLVREDNNPLFL